MPREPKVGDRICLISMAGDPNPIQFGETGTITEISRHGKGRDAWMQIDVDWDSGRNLMLSVPPDRFEFAGGE